MKYKDPVTGEWKELYTKTADTLPVGTVVEFEGDEVPAGWEEVEDSSYIVATSKGTVTLSGNTDIPLEITRSSGTSLILENNKIKVGKNISKLRISASIFLEITNFQTSGYLWGRIAYNGINAGGSITPVLPNMSFRSASIPSIILNVKEGDTVHLNADLTGSTGTVRNGSANTWICVESIE